MQQKHSYWQAETTKYIRPHPRLVLIAELVRVARVSSVLDVGASQGTLAHLLGRSYDYLGLDITGSETTPTSWPRVAFCDFDKVSIESASTYMPRDALVISGVLEYLEDWKSFLNLAISSWLKPGGLLLVSFINTDAYKRTPRLRHPKWRNEFYLPSVLEYFKTTNLQVKTIYPLFGGSGMWQLPISRWAAKRENFLLLNHPWSRQFLLSLESSVGNL